jgi:hypothetical protein
MDLDLLVLLYVSRDPQYSHSKVFDDNFIGVRILSRYSVC